MLLVCALAGLLAACEGGLVQPAPEVPAGSSPSGQAARSEETPPSSALIEGRQWQIADDGRFVTVENPTLRIRFAYNAKGWQGWFKGGGGQDGSIAELYYRPTSSTRNLTFRNGTWGDKLDGLDYFQAETAAVNQMDHNTADFASGTHGRVLGHRVWESAGRLYAEFDLDFHAWRITRTYIVYPWGDITLHARFTQQKAGRFNYLGRRIHFAVSRYRVANGATTYDWGGNYEADGEHFYAWSDGYGENGKAAGTGYFRYDELLRKDVNRNTVGPTFGRPDHYSGYMIDDRNQNDPDIVVMNGDPSNWESPFDRISRAVGGKAYIESGIFSPGWSNRTTHAGMNWFYNTIRCCPAEYWNPMHWPTSLGSWDESFHILLRPQLEPDDYLPLWQARAREVQRQQPYEVRGAQVRFDGVDRMYHLRAHPGVMGIDFTWQRGVSAPREIDYRTSFVVENLPSARQVSVEGAGDARVEAYRDTATGDLLVVLAGKQPAVPQPVRITVR